MWLVKLWLALAARSRRHRLVVDGRRRSYYVHRPAKSDAATLLPVVIALHGATMTGPLMAAFTGLDAKADEAGFLAVYPDGTGGLQTYFWNAGNCCGPPARGGVDDVAFLRALIDDLARTHRIDPARIYATGLSNGAMMAYRLASELADRIAAIACVGGTMTAEIGRPARPVPLLHVHGTEDLFVPYGGGKGSKSVTGFEYESVDRTIAAWVRENGCSAEPTVEALPDRAGDGTRVRRETYAGGRAGSEVVLVVVEGGGHTWPGRDLGTNVLGKSTRNASANDLIWEFFRRHPLAPPGAVTAGERPGRDGSA